MPPNPERERDVFLRALDYTALTERAAFVDGACGDDAALRAGVEGLLANHRTDSFLEPSSSPAMPLPLTCSPTLNDQPLGPRENDAGAPGLSDGSDPESQHAGVKRLAGEVMQALSERSGDTIGRYKLLEKLGEGGFGVVYMADQREPVRRKVALKIIKAGMDTREVVARFEAERQALALMDHPNIAKVLDGGATDSGRPYFVMELVRGTRITDFCDQNRLSVRERLDLFLQVCHAVQHAHQKGIIHRDLKPSNILVTLNDGVPVPKIIDFGIAKATQQELTEKTLFTAYGQFLGTPAYMSPEQTVLTCLDIDTRADIYSMGVLLYELLTGHSPFDTQELLKGGLDELCRTLREVEPPRPSTRLSTAAGEALASIAKFRQTEPPKLLHLVRGDLDWIVMKAIEKDRRRRYETANDLAADIRRHLRSEPILARPPNARYQFEKLVRRNKVAVTAVAAVFAVLVAGLATTLWQYSEKSQALSRTREAEREQARLLQAAETESTRSRQVATLLQDTLGGVHPETAKGRDTTVLRDILKRAERRIDAELKEQPLIAADLRLTLGRVYIALADLTNGVAMYREALALRGKVYPTQHVAMVEALHGLGAALIEARQPVEAERTLRQAMDINVTLRGRENAPMGGILNSLGFALERQLRYAEAEPILREAVALLKRHQGPRHSNVGGAEISLGETLWRQHKYAEAEEVLREAVEVLKEAHGEDDPTLSSALGALGSTLMFAGKPDQAEPILRSFVKLEDKLRDPGHPSVASARMDLAKALVELGNHAEAEEICDQALAIYRKAFGTNHSLIADALHLRGTIQARQGKYSEAEQMWSEALAMKESIFGRNHPDVVVALNSLGSLASVQGKHATAEKHFRDALAISLVLNGSNQVEIARAYQNLGLALHNQGRSAEAETALVESLKRRRISSAYEHPDTAGALRYLAMQQIQLNRPGEAEGSIREALELQRKFTNDDHPRTVRVFEMLAACLERLRKWPDLAALRRQQLDRLRQRPSPDRAETIDASSELGRILTEWAWSERANPPATLGGTDGIGQGFDLKSQEVLASPLGRLREAERILQQCLAARENGTNTSRGILGDAQSRLGGAVSAMALLDNSLEMEVRRDRLAEAEKLLLSGQASMQRSSANIDRYRRAGMERLVRHYTACNERAPDAALAAQAAQWQRKLAEFDRNSDGAQAGDAEQ